MHALTTQDRPGREQDAPDQGASRATIHQTLTLLLDGITADDYLQWVRDPDASDRTDLKQTGVRSAPLGECIELELLVEREPLSPSHAAGAVGFPITPDVAAVRCRRRASPPMPVRPDDGIGQADRSSPAGISS